ncbi:cation transporter [bacterium]|nr:cation transporter [bacterium]
MKLTLLLIGLVSIVAAVVTGQDKSNKETIINLPTIKCSMCVKTVKKAVGKLDGIVETNIDLDKKTATVKYDPAKVTVADIEKAITASGYNANESKRDADAYSKLPDCCQ